jgi:Fimbrial assembly protein (PilN)
MSQEINLLNTALIKQKDFLNAFNIAITLGLLSAMMMGYFGYAKKELSDLTIERSQIAEQLSAMDLQLKQATLMHTPHAPNKALLVEMSQLEQKEKMQQHILQIVKQSSASPEKGYAALMRAFAKQSIDGLWLTGFSFDNASEQLNINGRTLQANLVPEYISRLGHEPALKGKLFSALNMRLPKAEENKTATPQINNGAASSPSTTEALQAPPPPYIEFALQSSVENTLSDSKTTGVESKS